MADLNVVANITVSPFMTRAIHGPLLMKFIACAVMICCPVRWYLKVEPRDS